LRLLQRELRINNGLSQSLPVGAAAADVLANDSFMLLLFIRRLFKQSCE
jgi:hypothetical protein